MLGEIVTFRDRIERSLSDQDLAALKDASTECEVFLRANLPTLKGESSDIAEIVEELEKLVDIYAKALQVVTSAKEQTVKQITSLGKNRSNTRTYLDIAAHVNP